MASNLPCKHSLFRALKRAKSGEPLSQLQGYEPNPLAALPLAVVAACDDCRRENGRLTASVEERLRAKKQS